jgi:hypothetical protein
MNPLCGLPWWILCSWVGAPVQSEQYCGGTGRMKDWLPHGAIHEDEKLALDFAGPGVSHQSEQPVGSGVQGRHAEAR